ncbi:DnaJ domain-containing protein [Xylaria sp. FL1042]|nr:DnaJ domain-containing protein [Xylaria sp. FL1042]
MVRVIAWKLASKPMPAEHLPINNPRLSHYDVLNVSTYASDSEIKRAYRKQVLRYHPDKVQRLSAPERDNAKRKFDEFTHSYRYLLSENRCYYDLNVMKVSYEQYKACVKRKKKQMLANFDVRTDFDLRAQNEDDRLFEEQEGDELSGKNREPNSGKESMPFTAGLAPLKPLFTRFRWLRDWVPLAKKHKLRLRIRSKPARES